MKFLFAFILDVSLYTSTAAEEGEEKHPTDKKIKRLADVAGQWG